MEDIRWNKTNIAIQDQKNEIDWKKKQEIKTSLMYLGLVILFMEVWFLYFLLKKLLNCLRHDGKRIKNGYTG